MKKDNNSWDTPFKLMVGMMFLFMLILYSNLFYDIYRSSPIVRKSQVLGEAEVVEQSRNLTRRTKGGGHKHYAVVKIRVEGETLEYQANHLPTLLPGDKFRAYYFRNAFTGAIIVTDLLVPNPFSR